jgi:hypothetical protein
MKQAFLKMFTLPLGLMLRFALAHSLNARALSRCPVT